jgi:hypothetical protein
MEVIEVGIDLITGAGADGRPLSVVLYHDNGTPGSTSDDWGAYKVGTTNIPTPGEGWQSYSFTIPFQATALPADWTLRSFGGPPGDWNTLISNVARLRFHYGDPGAFYVGLRQWSVGMDNARIVTSDDAPPPGRIGAATLRASRVTADVVRLNWGIAPCAPRPHDFGIYEGAIGNWGVHDSVDCHDDAGNLIETVTTALGDRYFLVVPFNFGREGSYGLDSAGVERSRGSFTCAGDQSLVVCP